MALASLLAVVAAASGPALPAAAVPTVDCRRHVETTGVREDQRRDALRQSVIAHGVTFWGLRNAARRPFGGRRGVRGHKAGISVTHGAPMDVAIAPKDRGWLALDYDDARSNGERLTVGDGEPITRFVPCSPDTLRFTDDLPIGNETAWAGGFIVARPGCATLRLRRADESRWHDVRAGFGRRCR